MTDDTFNLVPSSTLSTPSTSLSPFHFHPTPPPTPPPQYLVFEPLYTSLNVTGYDTSTMLKNGALDVYYVPVNDMTIQLPLVVTIVNAWFMIYYFLMGEWVGEREMEGEGEREVEVVACCLLLGSCVEDEWWSRL